MSINDQFCLASRSDKETKKRSQYATHLTANGLDVIIFSLSHPYLQHVIAQNGKNDQLLIFVMQESGDTASLRRIHWTPLGKLTAETEARPWPLSCFRPIFYHFLLTCSEYAFVLLHYLRAVLMPWFKYGKVCPWFFPKGFPQGPVLHLLTCCCPLLLPPPVNRPLWGCFAATRTPVHYSTARLETQMYHSKSSSTMPTCNACKNKH